MTSNKRKQHRRIVRAMAKTFPNASDELIVKALEAHQRRKEDIKNGAVDWEGTHEQFRRYINISIKWRHKKTT